VSNRKVELTAFVLVSMLVFVVSLNVADAQKFDLTRFKGEKIRFFHFTGPTCDMELARIPEFEKLTGIKVECEQYSYGTLYDKLTIELLSGLADVDVFPSQPHVKGKMWYMAGYYEPLEEYLRDPILTNPEFDIHKYSNWDMCTFNGELIGVPRGVDVCILFYRKDLFEKYGVSMPDTFEEMRQVAKKLTIDIDGDGKVDVYGVVERGRYALATSQPWLAGYGGGFFDEAGNVIINSPESIQGLEEYVTLVRQYGPPGIADFSYEGLITTFAKGRAAQVVAVAGRYMPFADPTISDVTDKFDVAVVPRGPKKRATYAQGWMWNIYKGSKNKEAAWLFLQWLLKPKYLLENACRGMVLMPMPEIYDDPRFVESTSPGFARVLKETLKFAKGTYVPPILRGLEARSVVEEQITKAIEGEDLKPLLDKAARKLEELVVPGEFGR